MKLTKLFLAMTLAMPLAFSSAVVNAQEVVAVSQVSELNPVETKALELKKAGNIQGALNQAEKAYLSKENILTFDNGKNQMLDLIAEVIIGDTENKYTTSLKSKRDWFFVVSVEDNLLPKHGEALADLMFKGRSDFPKEPEEAMNVYAKTYIAIISENAPPEERAKLRQKIVNNYAKTENRNIDREVFNFGWIDRDKKEIRNIYENTRAYKNYANAERMIVENNASSKRIGRKLLEDEYMRGSYPAAVLIAITYLYEIGGAENISHGFQTLLDLSDTQYVDAHIPLAVTYINGIETDVNLQEAQRLINEVEKSKLTRGGAEEAALLYTKASLAKKYKANNANSLLASADNFKKSLTPNELKRFDVFYGFAETKSK